MLSPSKFKRLLDMAAHTIKTRILIISDTHCASLDGGPGAGFKRPLPPADLLIHCGDLTYTGTPEQYHKSLDMLKEINAPVKLAIAGNHDRTLDRDYMLSHLQLHGPTREAAEERYREMRHLWTAADGRAKQEGVTFLDEGTHTVDLPNGASAKVYTSAYTPEFYDWAFPYERDEDRFNPPAASLADAKNIAPYPVPSFALMDRPLDVMITHGPPYGRLDATKNGDLVGCPHLLRALMRARPLVHCFGHIHEGRGAERVRWSSGADQVAVKGMSTRAWTGGGWRDGVGEVKTEAQDRHPDNDAPDNAVYVDISQREGKSVARGEETVSLVPVELL